MTIPTLIVLAWAFYGGVAVGAMIRGRSLDFFNCVSLGCSLVVVTTFIARGGA